MITILLRKELAQHTRMMLGALVMTLSGLILALLYFANQEAPSLMRTAGSTVKWAAPPLAMLAARRLFVAERNQGTWELLSSLPISPLKLTTAKLGFGLLTVFGASSSVLLITAALVSRRELIALDWLFVMHLQALSYALAWFGIAAAFAHLGKHRLVGWSALIILLGTLDEVRPLISKEVFWLGPLWSPFDATRYAPPWREMLIASLWGLSGLATCLALSAYQGGALVQRWYTRMTGRQRATASTLIAVALLASELIGAWVRPPTGLRLLPKVGDGPVRAAADPGSPLWQHAERLNTELNAVGAHLGIRRWPQIALSAQTGDRRVPVTASGGARALILGIDLEAPPEVILRRGLFEALGARASYLVHWNESSSWVAKGFAEAWLRRRGHKSPGFELRAAWAAQRGVSAKTLEIWSGVEMAVGDDVAEAVAWAGLETVAERCGEPCLTALAKEVLSVWRPKRGLSVALQRAQDGPELVERITGMKRSQLTQLWQSRLQAHQRKQASALAAMPSPAPLSIIRVETASAAVSLSWAQRPRLEDNELWWTTTSALSAISIPQGRLHTESLSNGQTTLPLAIDPRSRVVATFAQRSPSAGGWLVFGWREVSP